MQRRLSIKRSFHCDDIAGLDHRQDESPQSSSSPHKHKRMRRIRQRATSLDSSKFCAAVCFGCDGGGGDREGPKTTSPLMTKFTPSVSASVSDDSFTPKVFSSLASIFSTLSTSPSNVTTAATSSAASSSGSTDEVGSLPFFPSLERNRSVSCDFPATAALEQFMLQQQTVNSPTTNCLVDGRGHRIASSPSEEDKDDGASNHLWPSFDNAEEGEDVHHALRRKSPCNVDGFPLTRRVSTSASSSCKKLHPSRSSLNEDQDAPTVNEITEALETLVRI